MKVTVTDTLIHDGFEHQPGDHLELDDDVAKGCAERGLVKIGVVEKLKGAGKGKKGEQPEPEEPAEDPDNA